MNKSWFGKELQYKIKLNETYSSLEEVLKKVQYKFDVKNLRTLVSYTNWHDKFIKLHYYNVSKIKVTLSWDNRTWNSGLRESIRDSEG